MKGALSASRRWPSWRAAANASALRVIGSSETSVGKRSGTSRSSATVTDATSAPRRQRSARWPGVQSGVEDGLLTVACNKDRRAGALVPSRHRRWFGMQVRTWRGARLRQALTPREWRRALGLAAVVIGLHAVGFFLLLVLVVPR